LGKRSIFVILPDNIKVKPRNLEKTQAFTNQWRSYLMDKRECSLLLIFTYRER